MPLTLNCEYCNKDFKSSLSNKRRFCSKECWYKSKRRIVIKVCGICEKSFTTKPVRNAKFCSRECYLKNKKENPSVEHLKAYRYYWKGKKRGKPSRETSAKRIETWKKKYQNGYINPLKNKTPWNKGLKTSPEVLLKLSESHKGQVAWNKLNRTPEELRETKRQYRKSNPAQFKAYDHKKRTLRKDLTTQIIQRVYEENIKQYGTLTCYLCLKPIEFGKDHLEHKTPISRGGSNEYENLAVACQACNCRKHTKTVEEFNLTGY